MYPVLACRSNQLVVSTLHNTCLVYKLSGDSKPPLVIQCEAQTEKDVDIEAKGTTLAAAFSNGGAYLALCNDYKQLLLYKETIEVGQGQPCWTLLSTRLTAKKGIRIDFTTDDSSLVVADKLGAVTSYSVEEPEKEGVVLLGHVSVLLDCKFICSGRYLATADRDEKIRISCYPHTYDIQAFCLGHTKYVTSLAEAGSWLLSAGGDATVRMWEPLTGQLVGHVTFDLDHAVQQIVYISQAKQAVCLLANSDKLIYVEVKDSGSLEVVNEQMLPATAIAMCSYTDSGVLVMVDRREQPLQFISLSDDDVSTPQTCTACVCQDLKARWSLFEGAVKYQGEFHSSMTKMDLQAIELGVGKKHKLDATNDDGGDKKTVKYA